LRAAQTLDHLRLQFGGGRVAGVEQVVNEDVAARRERVDERSDKGGRIFGVHDIVHDAAQQQPDRRGPVQVSADSGILQDARGEEQVAAGYERGHAVG
jgi:hypothetical protein